MKKRYIIKNLETGFYYTGYNPEKSYWTANVKFAKVFMYKHEAQNRLEVEDLFLLNEKETYQIITVYKP